MKGKFKEEDRPAYKWSRQGDRASWLPLEREGGIYEWEHILKQEPSSPALTRPPLGHAPIIFDGSSTAPLKKALFQGAKARLFCVASALGSWGRGGKRSAAGGGAKVGFGGGHGIEAKGGPEKGGLCRDTGKTVPFFKS